MVVFDQTLQKSGQGSVDIGAYDPVTDNWRMLKRVPLKAGRSLDEVQGVAAGSKVFVFAAWSQLAQTHPELGIRGVNGVDIYWLDPANESWSPVPSPETGVTQVWDPIWTGSELIADFNTTCSLCAGLGTAVRGDPM